MAFSSTIITIVTWMTITLSIVERSTQITMMATPNAIARTNMTGNEPVALYTIADKAATSAVHDPIAIFTFPVAKMKQAPVETVATIIDCWMITLKFRAVIKLPLVSAAKIKRITRSINIGSMINVMRFSFILLITLVIESLIPLPH
jgi:hypothetical protein